MLKFIQSLGLLLLLILLATVLFYGGAKFILLFYHPSSSDSYAYTYYFQEWLVVASIIEGIVMLIYVIALNLMRSFIQTFKQKMALALSVTYLSLFLFLSMTMGIFIDRSFIKNLVVLGITSIIMAYGLHRIYNSGEQEETVADFS